MADFKIPLDKEISKFKKHLYSNQRIIFSAKFGEGKTYFFDKLNELNKDSLRIITLRPVNYTVASNEDIFEYIKRDILLQLKDDGLYECIDFDAFTNSLFNIDNIVELLCFLTSALPGGDLLSKFIKKGGELKKQYDEKKQLVSEFQDKFNIMPGGIYERDAFTITIEKVVDRIKGQNKKVILIIEDLDRIDPQHLFRILNVLGAHIDDQKDSNKFGFDNIIVVMDYDITKHIFHHFYGPKANYSGYISKFVSHYPYEYSITKLAHNYCYQYLYEKCGLTNNDVDSFTLLKFPETVTLGQVISQLSIRDVVQIFDDLESQYETGVFIIRENVHIMSNAKIVILLSIIKRLNCKCNRDVLHESIISLSDCVGLSLLGDFMFCVLTAVDWYLSGTRAVPRWAVEWYRAGRSGGTDGIRADIEAPTSLSFASLLRCRDL